MKKIIIPFIAALFFCGCQKELRIDDSEGNSIMVLNAVPSAGKRAFVNFTNTHFFLDDNGSHPVQGAALTLYINGVPYSPDSVSRCKYFFPDTLREDDQLEIDITSPSGNVHAETYVPKFPNISATTPPSRWASPTFNFYYLPLKLSDHAGYKEIYSINVMQRDSGMRYDAWTHTYDTVDTIHSSYFAFLGDNSDITSNEVSPNVALADMLYGGLMFLDRRIDGQQNYLIELCIPIFKDTTEVVDSEHAFKHWYTVNVESITEDRFWYLISVARNNSMTSFFAEQAQPYSNVEGALGIFAGAAKWQKIFDTDTTPEIPIPMPVAMPSEALLKSAPRL